MVNRTFTRVQLGRLRSVGIVPMYWCADCRVEVVPEFWQSHYRTKAHRENLNRPISKNPPTSTEMV